MVSGLEDEEDELNICSSQKQKATKIGAYRPWVYKEAAQNSLMKKKLQEKPGLPDRGNAVMCNSEDICNSQKPVACGDSAQLPYFSSR